MATTDTAQGTTASPDDPTLAAATPPPASIAPTPGQITATAPANIQAFGATPQVATTYANAATVDPNSAQAYLQQYEQAYNTSVAPTNQQQLQQLQDSLSARGISNSGAAGQLVGQLQAQQGATQAAAYEPLIAQAFGYNQSDTAQNAQNQQAVNLANSAASNANATTNAGIYQGDINQNYSAYNNYENELFGAGENEQNSLLTAYLNSFDPSSGVTNAMSQGLAGQQSAYSNALNSAYGLEDAEVGAAGKTTAAGGA